MRARVVATTKADGDFNADLVDARVLAKRRRAVVDLAWTWLDEVHGTSVLTVTEPGEHAGARADALVTAVPRAAISVWVGDCAPVVLVADDAIGIAHAGWRGLRDGVLASTLDAMERLGAGSVRASIGPHIHSECYEFGADDLASMVDRFGSTVAATDRSGAPALDMAAAIASELDRFGVELVGVGPCTACEPDRYWSHRARGERGRQTVVAWLEPGE